MAYRRLPVFFALGAVLGWQMWRLAPHPWTWLQTLGLSMVMVGFCFWLTAHIQLGGLLFGEGGSASVGHARFVLEDPQSDLCLRVHWDRRSRALLEHAPISAGFFVSDSAASVARSKGSACSGR